MSTVVDRLHEEFAGLLEHLEQGNQPSFRITADEHLRKALLLAAASYFETEVTAAVATHAEIASQPKRTVAEFVRIKGLKRQYHTLFQWDTANANAFFGLFGPGFKQFMKDKVTGEPDLGDSIAAFMELGRERNRLVHENYGAYSLEKTAREIYALYTKAAVFVQRLPELLEEGAEAEEVVSQ